MRWNYYPFTFQALSAVLTADHPRLCFPSHITRAVPRSPNRISVSLSQSRPEVFAIQFLHLVCYPLTHSQDPQLKQIVMDFLEAELAAAEHGVMPYAVTVRPHLVNAQSRIWTGLCAVSRKSCMRSTAPGHGHPFPGSLVLIFHA